MSPVKSVYMFTDLEGAAGVDDWDPRHRDYGNMAKGVRDRLEAQRLLTGEVNAAAEGLFAAGVKEILINDAHGAGRTILVEELIPGVKIARGTNRPSWLLGITRDVDVLVQVGMHAMAGTPNACLAHTQSRGYVYRVNSREVGEMEQAALLAGELGIPWIFTAGDLHACNEAESWVPGMVSAPVKEGLGLTCAVHLSPPDARDLIKARIQDAIAGAKGIAPLTAETPVIMEVQRDEPWPAEIREGAERTDPFTLRYTGDSFWRVFHHHFYGKPDFPMPE
jgi:D-amino peptidase